MRIRSSTTGPMPATAAVPTAAKSRPTPTVGPETVSHGSPGRHGAKAASAGRHDTHRRSGRPEHSARPRVGVQPYNPAVRRQPFDAVVHAAGRIGIGAL